MVMKYKDRKRALEMANTRREAGYEEEYWSRLRSIVAGNSRSNSPAVKKLRSELAQKLKRDVASILSSDISEEEKSAQLTATLNQCAKSLPNQVRACQKTNAELLTYARKNLFSENNSVAQDTSSTSPSLAKEKVPELQTTPANSDKKYELRNIFDSLGESTQKAIAIKFFQFLIGFTESQLCASPKYPNLVHDAVLLLREVLGDCRKFLCEYGLDTPEFFAKLFLANKHKYDAQMKKTFALDTANPDTFEIWVAFLGVLGSFNNPNSQLNLILASSFSDSLKRLIDIVNNMKPDQDVIIGASSPAEANSDVAMLAQLLQSSTMPEYVKFSTVNFTTIGSYSAKKIASAKAVISAMQQQLPSWMKEAINKEIPLEVATRSLQDPIVSKDALNMAKIYLTAIRDLGVILENEATATESASSSKLSK